MFKLAMGLILVASIRALAADIAAVSLEKENAYKKENNYGDFAKASSHKKIIQDKVAKFRKEIKEVDAIEKAKPGTPLFSNNTAAIYKEYFANEASMEVFDSIIGHYKKLVKSGSPIGEGTLMKAVAAHYKNENENIKGEDLNKKLAEFRDASSFIAKSPEKVEHLKTFAHFREIDKNPSQNLGKTN